MITFVFPHDLFYWCLDDVSVIDISSKTELLINGHFENNSSDGNSSFCDGTTVDQPDYLNQTLDTKIGQVYQVSFWL